MATLNLLKRLAKGMPFGKPEVLPHWRTPSTLDRGTLGEARLALDGKGHGLALWENDRSLWTMPIGSRNSPALMRLPLGEGTSPRIVLNPDGRGIALWQAQVGGECQILGKILGGGDTMAHALFHTQGRVAYLQAAVDRRGNALVVWLHEQEGHFEVMANAFDTRGKTWEQNPTTLGIPSAESVEPRIAVNHREHAMVLWEVQEKGFEGLVASHYWPSDRIWSDRPVPVVAHATSHHQVVMDDQGNALALWIHAPYGQRPSLEASFYDVHHSEWGAPQILGSAHSFSTPRLAMSGDGQALAAWCQGEEHGGSRLYAKSFVEGRWETDMECLDPGQGLVQDFAIALGPDGRAGLLVLHQGAGGRWVSARLRNQSWSGPVALAPPSRTVHRSPRLVLCPEGTSALWVQGEGREQALILAETT